MLRFFSAVLIAAACIVCIVTEAVAQEPSQAQRDAIRASCRSDFIANCSGVQPGGKDAFECLKRNEAKLSASCKTAVNAVVPAASEPTAPQPKRGFPESPQAPAAAPAAATAQSQEDQLKIVRSVCTMDDFMAHCSWIAPNSPELLLCLKGNASNLSPACQQAVQTLAAEPAPVRPPPAAETSQPAPAAPAPAAKRTEPSRRPLPLRRLRHKNRAASSSAPSVPHADPISWHSVPACSQAVPQRSSACSKMRRGSRRRARPRLRPSLKLPAKAPLLERLRQLLPQRPQLLRLARCRRCVRAKLSPSCGYAMPSIRRCARAFRLAVAGSFPVWRRMRRHCRPAVTPR